MALSGNPHINPWEIIRTRAEPVASPRTRATPPRHRGPRNSSGGWPREPVPNPLGPTSANRVKHTSTAQILNIFYCCSSCHSYDRCRYWQRKQGNRCPDIRTARHVYIHTQCTRSTLYGPRPMEDILYTMREGRYWGHSSFYWSINNNVPSLQVLSNYQIPLIGQIMHICLYFTSLEQLSSPLDRSDNLHLLVFYRS